MPKFSLRGNVEAHLLKRDTTATEYRIVISRPPIVPDLIAIAGAITSGRGLVTVVKLEAGATWPDRFGLWLIDVALQDSGVAVLTFARLVDAQVFLRKVAGEASK